MREMDTVVEAGPRRRANFFFIVFATLLGALLVRLYGIQVEGHDAYAAQKDAQSRGHTETRQPRGGICDACGRLLAVSIPVDSVWANPKAIQDPAATAHALAAILSTPVEAVSARLAQTDREFVWIKRKVTAAEAEAIRRLAAAEKRRSAAPFGLATEFDRRYPYGRVAAHVVGFESDDNRHEGVERTMDRFLRGSSERRPVTVDGLRRLFGTTDWEESGAEVTLTIDLLFQQIVEEELDAAVAEFHPRSAIAIAIDPRTGAILAIANRPTFDPNDPGRGPADGRRDRALTDPFEPGSTIKPFFCAAALEARLLTPSTRIDCENGIWRHGPRTLHDHDPYGTLTVKEIISKSSNIGAAKIGALFLGRQRMYDWARAYGFGRRYGIDLPGEEDGRLFPVRKWTVFSDTSVPMGHEIAITPLQLVTAMGAIANGGWVMQPYVVSRVEAADGTLLHEGRPVPLRRILSAPTCAQMVDMLKDVMVNGTGRRVEKIPGLVLAGKTGTSQKIDPATRLYTHDRYIASFVGFAPADDPRIVIAVVIDEPQGSKIYGGSVAAPVVARILKRGMVHLK